MKNTRNILFLGSLAIGFYGSVSANAAEALIEQNERVQRSLEDAASRCEYDIKATIDVESFKAEFEKSEESKTQSLYRHCLAPVRGIAHWCALGFRESIGKEIKSVVCRYDKVAKKTVLKEGVLTFSTSWEKGSDWSKRTEKETGVIMRHGEFGAAQAELIRNNNGRVKDLLLDMSRDCKGYTVPWEIDWKSFEPEVDKRLGSNNLQSIWAECYEPLRNMTLRCHNAQSDLIKEQITSYICRYDAKKTPALTLENKVLTLTTNIKIEKYHTWSTNSFSDLLRDGDFSARQTDLIKDEEVSFKRLFSEALEYDCKATIPWTIDWKSFKDEIDKRTSKEETTSIYSTCGIPLNRLHDFCKSSAKVTAKMKKKIKSFKCVFGGKRKQKLKLKKGVLQYTVDFDAKDPYKYVDKFLVKKRIIKKRPPPKKLTSAQLKNIRRILGSGVSPQQQCKRACSKTCRSASNKSKCKNRCRANCR